MSGLHTLGRWTADRALATPDRTAIDDRGVRLSYRELDTRAAALAGAFQDAGYRHGDRIATVTGNSADHVVLFFACAKAGLVLVPLSWRLSARELAAQLQLADPALLLVEDEFSSVAAAAASRLPVPPPAAPLGRTGVEAGPPPPLHLLPPGERPAGGTTDDDDPLLMVFTSGTQADPKAVVLSHANCFWTNLSLSRTAEIGSHDVVLAVLPQFHAGGWNIQPLLAWWTGATVVLERTFDAGRILQLIEDRRVTTMMGVPANYLMLASHPRFASADLSSLGRAVVGGAPMPAPLLRTWHSRGVALAQGYGLSEAGPNVLCLPEEEAEARIGMAGKPYPHVDVAVADPVTGELQAGPCTGELLVAGPGVFQGYFRNPEATAAALAGGWLHTGDLVERDADGYLRVIDRLKDIYISGGENVAPAEVEAVLREHPAVAEAAVTSVPDPQWGETGIAYVVRRPGTAADALELLEHCSARLARFKVPSRISFVDGLPRTSLHKIARSRLGKPEPGVPATSLHDQPAGPVSHRQDNA
ncbi:class I adenylate-forming enzyme family protein [Arthrobacter caoxuetaonis]|uniref:class I adenylate-forming enzyme family protein n=1 Tax=Arthrobacter caoxuetaonis TaxID=2886935 RepID=UPI001D13C2B2|nr:AMP-binding protein [Arthrobacter caoxuetaonis]MCC3280939.1 AMP-binding protein [Arthrobacter caoxuetaonis]